MGVCFTAALNITKIPYTLTFSRQKCGGNTKYLQLRQVILLISIIKLYYARNSTLDGNVCLAACVRMCMCIAYRVY